MRAEEEVVAGPRRGRFWRRFGALFGLGLIGVLSMIPAMGPELRRQAEAVPDLEISPDVLVALSLLNPLILMGLGVAIGVLLAPRIGLVSLVEERVALGRPVLERLAPQLPVAIGLGAAGGTLLIVLDLIFMTFLIDPAVVEAAGAPRRTFTATLAGMLYGGITEELMVRWGLVTLFAWAGWRVTSGGKGRPGPAIMWTAISAGALLFGVAHLPGMAILLPLTGAIVVRTIALNAIGGFFFGWLYWRRSLEAAMVAHATFHVAFTVIGWAFL
jgi:hypothetical protein